MRTLYAFTNEARIFFCEEALTEYMQASIQDVPLIQDAEIIAAEGRHIAHDGKWILVHTVESLAASQPRAATGSVEKAMVITKIQDHLRQQSDDVNEVTLYNTSSHCNVIGGRIARQVVSTVEAGKYLDEHLDEIGWEVAKAGKDFISLKRRLVDEGDVEEIGMTTIQQAFENHECEVANKPTEEEKKGLWGLMKSR